MSLVQKYQANRYFERWEYVLKEDVVEVRRVDLLDSESYDIRYEEISNDPTEVQYSSKPRAIFAICVWCWCAFAVVVQLFAERNWRWILLWLAASAMAYVIWYLSKRHYLVFSGTRRNLILPVPKTEDAGLQPFIDALLAKRRQRILATFSDPDAPKGSLADELQKLAWLRNTGVLSESEFDDLKKRLLSGELIPNPSQIGFRDVPGT